MSDSINAWNNYAQEYNMKTRFSDSLIHIGLALPGIPPHAIVRTCKSVLDIGCGSGLNTHLMAKLPDITALGVDPVKTQIEHANTHFSGANLEFAHADYYNIPVMHKKKFDLITFLGSIDYIPLDSNFFDILNGLTNKESRCYISKFHPLWTTLFCNDTDEESSANSYFDIERNDSVRFGEDYFNRYHYSICEILSRFHHAGWTLSSLDEPLADFGKSAFAYEGYEGDSILRQRLTRFPMTLVLEFERR